MANGGKASDSPNILIILNDDMGFSDIGCYGGEIETPNLDRLAANGLRYSQFYNTARCSPSRASLLTGLHPHQTGIGILTYSNGPEGYAGDLNKSCVTVAEVLKQKKYKTYLSGKWHVSSNLTQPTDSWPLQRGFDYFFGTIIGAGSFYHPSTLTRGNDNIEHEAEKDPSFFYTDAISDQAAAYIRQHKQQNPDTPFFQYVAYTAPHWPLHAHDEDIAKYKGRFDAGWDRLREQRLQRLIDDGIIHPNWQLTDRDPTQPPWTEAEHREWTLRCMEVYAAQIDRMDQGIGRIISALEETGQLENTLIIFLSDNGACAEDIPEGVTAKELVDQLMIAKAKTRKGEPVRFGNDPIADARRRGHLSELWHRLGQSLERAVPALQALDPRRRHRDAVHRALAARHQGKGRLAAQSEPASGHHGDHRRRHRRHLPEGIQRQCHPAAGGREPGAVLLVRLWRARAAVLGARGQCRRPHRQVEAGAKISRPVGAL